MSKITLDRRNVMMEGGTLRDFQSLECLVNGSKVIRRICNRLAFWLTPTIYSHLLDTAFSNEKARIVYGVCYVRKR